MTEEKKEILYGGIPLEELAARFRELYVPAVADCLDDKGFTKQLLDKDIKPLKLEQKVAGPAYTVRGIRDPEWVVDAIGVMDKIPEHYVSVWDTGGDTEVGHWGELMTNAALQHNTAGAVIDGGIRDTGYILPLDFPLFHKFRCAADALGRWRIIEYQIPIRISGVLVRPGDYIFGDLDGVVVIPKDLVVEILETAEAIVAKENEIRDQVRKGQDLDEMKRQFRHRR